jgi:hypothetical protein
MKNRPYNKSISNIHCTGAWPSGRFGSDDYTATPGERIVMTVHLVNWANSLVSVSSTVGTRGHYRKLPRCPGAETGSRKGVATAARASHPTSKGLVLTQTSVRQNKADVVALAWDKGWGVSRRRPNIHCTGAWPSGGFVSQHYTATPGERVVGQYS